MRTSADQILLLLKTKGPTQTKAVAEAVGVTRQAARLQMEKLAAEGLVEHATEKMGVGRPRRSWSLTRLGDERFPNTHAQLTVEVLDAVREEFGEAGLERLIARREGVAANTYSEAMNGADTLQDRVSRLAALRTAEGYMAECSPTEGGGFLLTENHCPICAAASFCQGFCRSELDLFRNILAPADVERVDHILAGARRCAYRITPATP